MDSIKFMIRELVSSIADDFFDVIEPLREECRLKKPLFLTGSSLFLGELPKLPTLSVSLIDSRPSIAKPFFAIVSMSLCDR